MGDITKNFSRGEFACRDGCGRADIDVGLVRVLQEIRDELKTPLVITSGVRCEKHNAEVGGTPNSAHVKGLAADIATPSGRERFMLLWKCMERFGRVGIGKSFIHVDIAPDLPQRVCWVYGDSRG